MKTVVEGNPAAAGRWWIRRRITGAAIAACAVMAAAFVVRFNALGGALGGFDNDHFIYLIRTDMLLDGGQPLRDFVDAELRGAWPALTYLVSAWAQQLGGPTLLTEAYLTVGLLALAHALVFLLALDLSKRWTVALLAAIVAIATFPKLYNYPKVVALALGVWSVRAIVLRPSMLRLGLAAVVTAVGVWFRHDLGLYVAAGIAVGLVARDVGSPHAALQNVAAYVAFTAVCLLPSAVWVHWYEGIPEYVRSSAATVAEERSRTGLNLPSFDRAVPLAFENMELVTYYGFRIVPLVAVTLVCVRLTRWRGIPLSPGERATAVGLLIMAVLVNMSMLRANLSERFSDAVVPVVLLAAWMVGSASLWSSATARRAVVVGPTMLLLAMLAAAYVYSDIGRELETTGLAESLRKTMSRYQAVRQELMRVPPTVWADADAQGTLGAARYVAECTTAGDRVLGIGPVHEIPVFARRRFAGGQAMFKFKLYTSEAFQRRAVARLRQESVPLVIADAAEFEYFPEMYPLVAQYVADKYTDAGVIAVNGEPRFRVLAASDREPVRIDSVLGLPCFA